jgi:hypothetical protein
MKRFMFGGLPVLLVFLVGACSKQRASGPAPAGDSWFIVKDSFYTGAVETNHLVVYEGMPGDYFDFGNDGNIYTRGGATYDTFSYKRLADSAHIVINDFGGNVGWMFDTSAISDHTATSMTIATISFATPGGIFWKKVVLSK